MTRANQHTDDPTYVGLLNEIYGEHGASRVIDRYRSLVTGHDTGRNATADRRRSAQSWLIAYPDHVSGSMKTPLAQLDTFIEQRLRPHFSGVHVLPCFPSSSDEGFSVTDYTSIDDRYGTWDDIERLASHGNLMLDAVINHASVHGLWFRAWQEGVPEYAGFFRTESPDTDLTGVVRARQHPLLTRFDTARGVEWVWTTFSADQADLDYRNPEVMLAIAEVILTYAHHGASAIRLDAVGFLWKEAGSASIHMESTHKIIQLLRATLDATYPDVLLVSETNVPHEENVSYLGDGTTREADMVYQFPLPPLTLHAFTTGDATALKEWLSGIEDTPRSTTFFNFLASHDGVGLRPLEGLADPRDVQTIVDVCIANGGLVTYRSNSDGSPVPYELNATWFDLIRGSATGSTALARHVASHGLMFALQGEPAVYMQALLAEPNAVDLAEETSQPRSMNRKRFDAAGLDRLLDDPRSSASQSLMSIREMLEWRNSCDAFFPSAAQRILSTSRSVIGVERTAPSGTIARIYVNVGADTETVDTEGWTNVKGYNIVTGPHRATLGPYGIAWMTDAAAPRS